MIQLHQDFREFLKLLNLKKVEYLVIGGYAVGLYGYPRATGGLDIWIAVSSSNANLVAEALREFGFDFPQVSESLFSQKEKVIRMGNPPIRIEVLTSISGVEFYSAYPNRRVETIDGIEINFIGMADLIENKKASGRHKDIDDIEHLK